MDNHSLEQGVWGHGETAHATQEVEIHLLLEALRLRFGYDFHHYSQDSLKRRILQSLTEYREKRVSAVIPRLLYEQTFLDQFIASLAVTVTTLFRDPPLYRILRDAVVPVLRTYPFVTLWHAGCATGEEVYAMAILLQEEGLLARAQFYATDLNGASLRIAEKGLYPAHKLKEYSDNYRQAGGKGTFMDHCQIKKKHLQMDPELKRNMLFSTHNLASDAVFTQAHVILCRNVLIYFNRTLQNKVLHLLSDSLVRGGFLCLGDKESLAFSEVANHFTVLSETMRVFKKQPSTWIPLP